LRLYSGSSGFSFPEWKGSFYPADLPQRGFLAHYAARLDAVELNNTFYRMPKPELLSGWADQVPDHFRFALKAPAHISCRIKPATGAGAMAELSRALRALGPRLGPVLFQLPPELPIDLDRLAALVALVPDGMRAAFELRHESWRDPAVHTMLRAAGAALCISDMPERGEPPMVATADFGYLRLRRARYPKAKLETWLERMCAAGWQECYVFFRHEDSAAAPRLARRLMAAFDDRNAPAAPEQSEATAWR
jgi:uncharacterized protein YecE (DUF72 family)